MLKTDIAQEACEKVFSSQIEKRQYKSFGLDCLSVEIKSDEAEKLSGKRKGIYISIQSDAIIRGDKDEFEYIARAISGELKKMIPKNTTVLVAGLGNRELTPDSMGTLCVEKTIVTRHIFEFMPKSIDERFSSVSAIAPGVLGVTGIESADIISSVAKRISAGVLIVIDSLAARESERLFSTFQISTAGIEPGAGVGNKRSALTEKTVGIPVIAVGVPTVVYASSIVYSAIVDATKDEKRAEKFSNMYSATKDMVVTPKEIDIMIEDASQILSDGINLALHDISYEEIKNFSF